MCIPAKPWPTYVCCVRKAEYFSFGGKYLYIFTDITCKTTISMLVMTTSLYIFKGADVQYLRKKKMFIKLRN